MLVDNIKYWINKTHLGNCLELIKQIPDNAVDCVITSPPYWNLRNYKTEHLIWGGNQNCEHEWKNNFCNRCNAWQGELGSEPTVDLYVNNLVQIFQGIKRILKDTGSCFINIGDVYAPSTKTLCMIPYRFSIKMADDGWCLRNLLIWKKDNQMPQSCSDRFTVDFEPIFFFVKNPAKYYFKQQLEPYTKPMNRWGGEKLVANGKSDWDAGTGQVTYRNRNFRPNPKGRNMRTVWSINTSPFPGAHFACFPVELVTRIINAVCPKEVCSKCGLPVITKKKRKKVEIYDENNNITSKQYLKEEVKIKCNCNVDYVPGIVLDPFMGAGTTALVAKKLNVNYIGLELNPGYVLLTEKRIL